MIDPFQFEEDYRRFVADLNKWVPDGIIEINLELLNGLGLLDENSWNEEDDKNSFQHYFHVIESTDKVTLYNDQFVIWIVPQNIDNQSFTLTLISFVAAGKLRPEIVFSTRGIYNNPKCILKVLRSYIEEVIDTQNVISSMT